jgi:hypothetical protein
MIKKNSRFQQNGFRSAFNGMKKRILKIATICLILTMTLSQNLLVKAEVSQQTINYLLALPQDQWITMGLSAAGRTDFDLGYLASFNGASSNDFAKTVLALAAANQNPADHNGTDYVNSLRGYYQNNQFGSAELLSDDFWAIMAIRSAGNPISDDMVQASKNFILGHQNANGGFSYAPGADSDTNDTAAAIMALLDAGLEASESHIQSAINYLHTQQNQDGGFPYVSGSQSDSGSDAWVISAIYKLNDNPTSWTINQNNPLTHLQTLALNDGSFKWIATDTQGNPLMTVYAAVALAGKSYPVSYYQPGGSQPTHHLRIEGQNNTYCDTDVPANTALQIIENGASLCGYTFNIQQASFGRYLSAINNESASGNSGWMYRVNWLSPMVGADNYTLQPGDEVLWSYSQYGNQPLRITLGSHQIQPGGQATATVEYFNETDWLPANEATVHAGNQILTTNTAGQAVITFAQAGNYQAYAEKTNFIRSPKINITVGSGISQTVNLSVNVEGTGGSETLSFSVSPSDLSFGSLRPGQSALRNLTVTNNGTVSFHIEAAVNGDSLFQENTYLNSSLWQNYSDIYSVNQSKTVATDLRVPAGFAGRGQKQGSLIFWAVRN